MFCFWAYEKADPAQISRTEDQIIAWTWKTFIESNGSDPYILLRMPMTKVRSIRISDTTIALLIEKAAVRAMDAAQQFLRQKEIQVPEKFVVAGASKVRAILVSFT